VSVSRKNGPLGAEPPPAKEPEAPADGFELNGEPKVEEPATGKPKRQRAPQDGERTERRRTVSGELAALQDIDDIMSKLDPEARVRVIGYANGKYGARSEAPTPTA
jgi:hypothetical protein